MPRQDKSSPTAASLEQEAFFLLQRIADVRQKMRQIGRLPAPQQDRMASQAKYVYMPIVHRLGLVNIKAELEDLHLKFYAAPVYHSINQLLGSDQEERLQFIAEFRKPLETTLRQEGFDFITKSRVKSITSIINKMNRLSSSLEEIYDVFAIRVILDVPFDEEKDACWQVHDILTQRYKALLKKFTCL